MDKRDALKPYLADYLRQKGINITKPFCCLSSEHADKHPSMSYNKRTFAVHCFACGVTYDIFDLIGLDYGISGFAEQLERVTELFLGGSGKSHGGTKRGSAGWTDGNGAGFAASGRALQVSGGGASANKAAFAGAGGAAVAEETARVFPIAEPMPDRSDELYKLRGLAMEGTPYFASRGISAELCEKYGLFETSDRAYMPLYEGGACTGWCARAKNEGQEPRYQNSTGRLGLWNGDILRGSPDGGAHTVFVTEGVLNALTLCLLGCDAVALCGSQNVRKLLEACEQNAAVANVCRFVACGDNDRAGESMNKALCEGLRERGLACGVMSLGEGFAGDINDLYLRDAERLREAVRTAGEGGETDAAGYAATAAGEQLDEFFAEGARRAKRRAISSGFAELDELLDGGFYSGLYVLGAISSLGKTSFILQLADYIAEHSADVLFFSLEQSRFELMAKSLSRTSAVLDSAAKTRAFTARQLLRGDMPCDEAAEMLLEKTKTAYAKAARGLFLREGISDIGAAEIREAVREHIALRGASPVVVVDYLQILKPFDARSTDKQNTDRAVVDLKRISRDFDLPVIAISSFNRDNYRNAVSMEAFKESGAVEYSSDVLFGMQLAGAGESGFDVNAAKSKEPRQVELVMLKNRNGIPYAKLKLDYYAKFSLFVGGGQRPRESRG